MWAFCIWSLMADEVVSAPVASENASGAPPQSGPTGAPPEVGGAETSSAGSAPVAAPVDPGPGLAAQWREHIHGDTSEDASGAPGQGVSDPVKDGDGNVPETSSAAPVVAPLLPEHVDYAKQFLGWSEEIQNRVGPEGVRAALIEANKRAQAVNARLQQQQAPAATVPKPAEPPKPLYEWKDKDGVDEEIVSAFDALQAKLQAHEQALSYHQQHAQQAIQAAEQQRLKSLHTEFEQGLPTLKDAELFGDGELAKVADPVQRLNRRTLAEDTEAVYAHLAQQQERDKGLGFPPKPLPPLAEVQGMAYRMRWGDRVKSAVVAEISAAASKRKGQASTPPSRAQQPQTPEASSEHLARLWREHLNTHAAVQGTVS